MLNDGGSLLILPIWAFLGGSAYALAVYWLGGGLLFGAARRLGSLGCYRRARQLLALSTAPLVLSLVTLWPLRIAIYGEWYFRTGGNDYGTGDHVFNLVALAVFVWCAVLLAIGVRAVHGWTWARSLATVGLAASVPVLLAIATHAHLTGGLN
jgi:Yip1 domain